MSRDVVRTLLRARCTDIPDDVVCAVADAIAPNGHAVNGAAHALALFRSSLDHVMTVDDGLRAISGYQPHGGEQSIRIEDIIRAVCAAYGIERMDVLSQRRAALVSRPRQVICYLAKRLTPRSLPEIGRMIGGRDHTTVLHAVRRIEDLITRDAALRNRVEAIEAYLSGVAA